MSTFIKINAADNVAVAVNDAAVGDVFECGGVCIRAAVPITSGHKMALEPLKTGDNVVKYGFPIGRVIADVPAGGLIDHSNLKTNLSGLLEYSYEPELKEIHVTENPAMFKGYRRADGRVGR